MPSSCNESLITIGDELVPNEVPLWNKWTFHHFGLAITSVFALIATVIALFLIFQHATHYSQPWKQKHIIRILFMIPVYAVISLISYVFYKHALYYQVLRDCYEAFAIASFFTLLCHYLEPTLHEQKNYFRRLQPRNWVLPVSWVQKCTGGTTKGPLRIPRSGLTWFNIIYVGVYQYCFIRVLFTFVAMGSQFDNRYCESSLSPAFAHIWVLCFEAVSVTIAMYCLIQFYIQLKDDLAEHKPFLKVLCIKLVIFFSFWQSLLISFLTSSRAPGGGILKSSPKVAYPDLIVGIPSVLLAVEMSIFAVIHIFAFSAKPYDIRKNPDVNAQYSGGFMGWKALLDAFNLWDIVKASARGFKWLFVGSRHREQDSSYEEHRRQNPESVKLDSIPTKYPGAQYPKEGYGNEEFSSADTLGRVGTGPENERPRPTRRETNESDDRAGLLAHSQNVPKISVQPSSPYRDPSPYSEGDAHYQDGQGPGPFKEEPSGYDPTKPYDTTKPR